MGPLPGSEVWTIVIGYLRGDLLRAHTKGPCNYPETLNPKP